MVLRSILHKEREYVFLSVESFIYIFLRIANCVEYFISVYKVLCIFIIIV